MAIAISLEAGEWLEHFLWKNPDEAAARVDSHREAIRGEIADIAIHLTELADNLGIDLVTAMEAKREKNAARSPVEKARGSAATDTEL